MRPGLMADTDALLRKVLDPAARVVFFPVRHHSPTCARLVYHLASRLRPAAVLIEGPSDFNDRIAELALPHQLPIAVYSHVRLADGRRRGAYHPFCVYSPEWQALRAAWDLKAEARFIDLPWADIAAAEEEPSHRYADPEMRRSRYVASLCRQLGVEDFDALWDTLFELDPGLTPEQFLERCHQFCLHVRVLDETVSAADRRREAFMAAEVRRALDRHAGRLLVVTGGYHSLALAARLAGLRFPGTDEPPEDRPAAVKEERGIALTPYSYERLDALKGYEAGMPNPGYYHEVWQDRQHGRTDTHRRLLARVAAALRKRNQLVSAADLIAAETTAGALAALRGHPQVWRSDLVDGLGSALLKEELAYGYRHPLLEAVHEVLRGGERGRLAEGTALPALVQELRRELAEHGLEPEPRPREVELDLANAGDRTRSRLLHCLRLLGIAGFRLTVGADLTRREDLVHVEERWQIQWGPEHDATAVEASRYGPTLADAAGARLAERAAEIERSAERAALLLLDAALAGVEALAGSLAGQLAGLIRADGDFLSVTAALGHLLYLYRYDAVLGTAGCADAGTLLHEAYGRGLWLLEGLGQGSGTSPLDGVRALLEAFERCGGALALDRRELADVLRRVGADRSQAPAMRGAAAGALWTLGEADAEGIRRELRLFTDPALLGDFLTGLFSLAREVVQRHPELLRAVDAVLVGYSTEDFLVALPALRLAFTYFTPREKHHLARALMEALGLSRQEALEALEVDAATAARALAFEARLFAAVERYGLRGGQS